MWNNPLQPSSLCFAAVGFCTSVSLATADVYRVLRVNRPLIGNPVLLVPLRRLTLGHRAGCSE